MNLTENLCREREVVSEQNKTIKLLKVEMSDLLSQSSGCQEELASLLCERTNLVQSLAERSKTLRTLERRLIDQEDVLQHCQQQLETEQYYREVLQRKLENSSGADHQSFNLELTSKRTEERGDSESYEEDDLCIQLVNKHSPSLHFSFRLRMFCCRSPVLGETLRHTLVCPLLWKYLAAGEVRLTEADLWPGLTGLITSLLLPQGLPSPLPLLFSQVRDDYFAKKKKQI